MTQEKACAAVDHLFQNLIGLVGGAYNFSLAHLSRGGAVLPPPSGHERQTPPHLNYFRRLDKPKAGSCPQGCCLAVPSSQGTLLVLGADEAAGQPAVVIGRLILAALARELEHLAELEKLRDQAEFGEKIVRSMSSGFMVLRPDLRVINANQAACDLLQTTLDKLIGSKLSDFIFSKLLIKQVFATGKAVKDREVFIKLADRDLHILKTAEPVFGRDGSVIAVLDHFKEIKETRQLVSRMSGARASFTFDDIIHKSQVMNDVIELGKMAAGNALSVLITGESGTGKELFAHAIHLASPRRKGPFVVIDCASMPRELVGSELFGYNEGAFTGARKGGTPGKFELANGGTIFLDELGELPLEIQSQFLRVLQSRQVMRLGGKDMLPVDIRIIAATNRDLAREVKRGNFREDLFYRLNVLAIHIPALRSRPEDILGLAEYFAKKYCQIIGKNEVTIARETRAALMEHNWPGNVRELENAVAKAVHICETAIEPDHFRLSALTNGYESLNGPKESQETAPLDYALPASFRDMEAKAIREAIAVCSGNISKAAKRLGVARSTIYKKMAVWK